MGGEGDRSAHENALTPRAAGPGDDAVSAADEARGFDALAARLRARIAGARVEKVSFVAVSGLLAFSLFGEGARVVLGVGIGPECVGVGLFARMPEAGRVGSAHPLVTALRAHVVEHRVRDVLFDDDGVLWLSVGGNAAVARVAVGCARQGGGAQVFSAEGRAVLRFPPANKREGEGAGEGEVGRDGGAPGLAVDRARVLRAGDDVAASGVALREQSERVVARRVRVELLRAVKTRAMAAARRADAVRGDLARLGDVARLQKVGRLLIAQGDAVSKGAARATLDDWEEGGMLEVTLDPSRPAKAQAEGFFAKARRLQRGERVMRVRLDEAERAALALRELVRAVEASPERVEALSALLPRARSLGVSLGEVLSGLLQPREGAGARAPREGGRRPFHRYRDARGRVILVGRGGRDNDALLTQHARPHDLWLHVKGSQGAHVVVPLEKGQSCPPELLVDAATLAAHFSDARDEALCEVSYVERRYVRKPKGAAPGFVTLEREKVLPLRVETARLERLLASREEG